MNISLILLIPTTVAVICLFMCFELVCRTRVFSRGYEKTSPIEIHTTCSGARCIMSVQYMNELAIN